MHGRERQVTRTAPGPTELAAFSARSRSPSPLFVFTLIPPHGPWRFPRSIGALELGTNGGGSVKGNDRSGIAKDQILDSYGEVHARVVQLHAAFGCAQPDPSGVSW